MLISIIIPVLNESAIMDESLSRLVRTGDEKRMEIIVVDGNSHDNSVEIARKYTDNVLVSSSKGRGYQLHTGALAAKGEILFFVHIDTKLPDTWFNDMMSLWKKKNYKNQYDITSFLRVFCKTEWPFNLICSLANIWFLFTKIPHGDQTISIHRDTYFECGGFPHVPIMEEYVFLKQLKKLKRNVKLKILPGRVTISTRRYEKSGPFRLVLINTSIVFLYHMGIPLRLLARIYY